MDDLINLSFSYAHIYIYDKIDIYCMMIWDIQSMVFLLYDKVDIPNTTGNSLLSGFDGFCAVYLINYIYCDKYEYWQFAPVMASW